jgi:hypothetical protein
MEVQQPLQRLYAHPHGSLVTPWSLRLQLGYRVPTEQNCSEGSPFTWRGSSLTQARFLPPAVLILPCQEPGSSLLERWPSLTWRESALIQLSGMNHPSCAAQIVLPHIRPARSERALPPSSGSHISYCHTLREHWPSLEHVLHLWRNTRSKSTHPLLSTFSIRGESHAPRKQLPHMGATRRASHCISNRDKA